MSYTLGQAAKATGKSKTTILRAIQKSKISAVKNAHGQWSISPSELHRVYPIITNSTVAQPITNETQSNTNLTHENKRLQDKLEAVEKRISDKDETIADLRERLDRESEERRKLTAMIVDMRPEAPQSPSDGLQGFWARVFTKK